MKFSIIFFLYFSLQNILFAQLTENNKQVYTKADTLRGSNNENRNWWDVLRYDITVKPNFEKKEIEGVCKITYTIERENFKARNKKDLSFQIDLQEGLIVDSVITETLPSSLARSIHGTKSEFIPMFQKIFFKKENGIYLINFFESTNYQIYPLPITIYYHGKPREAKKAPWDGGWVWSKDKLGRPFVSVACQGLGASSWYPCKDIQSDEPDLGASITIIVPDSLMAVGNGRLTSKIEQETKNKKQETSFTWEVKNPINNYTIIPTIGNLVNISDTFMGEKGILDLNYWVLDYNKEKALEQFQQVKLMLKAFEYWFGPYPFYEDGYKLLEAPYLGMEHQSAIAYGNEFKNGYLGRDLSSSGWGLKWDFIIVHESGHEWFANSITTKDIADMWVHEGFTNYSEVLFTDYYYGKEAGNDYCFGIRKKIRNDKSIIGIYGVNNQGSGDMYPKAANMIHGIRNALNDDEKFRNILRGMNETFYHQTVTTQQIENFLIEKTGLTLQKTFDQYLRTTQIPTLQYYFKGRRLFTKFNNCIEDYTMPITVLPNAKTIYPKTKWRKKRMSKKNKEWFNKEDIERLYLLNVENVPKP